MQVMTPIDDEKNRERLNAPSVDSEATSYINGYLSGLNDSRAQILLARTKELKHEALDFADTRIAELGESILRSARG